MIGVSPSRPGYFHCQPDVLVPEAMPPSRAARDEHGGAARHRRRDLRVHMLDQRRVRPVRAIRGGDIRREPAPARPRAHAAGRCRWSPRRSRARSAPRRCRPGIRAAGAPAPRARWRPDAGSPAPRRPRRCAACCRPSSRRRARPRPGCSPSRRARRCARARPARRGGCRPRSHRAAPRLRASIDAVVGAPG